MDFTVAVVGLAGLAWLAWVLLGLAGYRRHGVPALRDTVGVLQLVFASVAGAGALVALIVAYRRQKVAEADSIYDRTRVFNERFTAIAIQLGDAQPVSPRPVLTSLIDQAFTHVKDHSTNHNSHPTATATMATLREMHARISDRHRPRARQAEPCLVDVERCRADAGPSEVESLW
jgi:hypothetical protein